MGRSNGPDSLCRKANVLKFGEIFNKALVSESFFDKVEGYMFFIVQL